MSRAVTGDVVVVKPTNNVYTVLAAIAVIAELIALIDLFVKAGQVFGQGKGLF